MALNLLPASEQRKRKEFLLNYYTLVGGIVLVVGSLLMAALLLLFSQVYRLNLDTAKAERASAESQASQYLDVEKKALELSKQLDNLKRAQAQTTHWATLLTDLQAYTPVGVSIESMSVKTPGATGAGSGGASANKTEISGSADSRRSAAQFQIALAESPNFKNVQLDTTSTSGDGPVEYRISMEVNFDRLNGPQK